jgi:poly(3-hydroxybutyrate) depolymerase
MTIRFAVVLTLALTGCREASSEASATESPRVTHNVVSPPCSGCTVDLPPERRDPQPVLFVLHGNRGSAKAATARWRDAALARGFAVVGLMCPREEGCEDGTWYAWERTPQFVLESLGKVREQLPIDPARTYLAGWSGGASAIGQHLGAWTPFSAIVIHGGGQPPADGACPSHATPAYFLVGDGNPAHGAAIALRDHLEKCDATVEWDLLRNAGHADEKRALDREKAAHILEWLDTHAASDHDRAFVTSSS